MGSSWRMTTRFFLIPPMTQSAPLTPRATGASFGMGRDAVTSTSTRKERVAEATAGAATTITTANQAKTLQWIFKFLARKKTSERIIPLQNQHYFIHSIVFLKKKANPNMFFGIVDSKVAQLFSKSDTHSGERLRTWSFLSFKKLSRFQLLLKFYKTWIVTHAFWINIVSEKLRFLSCFGMNIRY